jgi:putative ubiquitin-RnfH superfamily antitoxin RatB of RatAB toxin-antitoxin module
MRVSVAMAVPSRQEVVEIDLPEGSTVADAIAAVNPQLRFAGIGLETVEVGVWGVRATREAVLREGDRVELYRALRADPKDQRRRRAAPKPSPRSRSGP